MSMRYAMIHEYSSAWGSMHRWAISPRLSRNLRVCVGLSWFVLVCPTALERLGKSPSSHEIYSQRHSAPPLSERDQSGASALGREVPVPHPGGSSWAAVAVPHGGTVPARIVLGDREL